MKLGAPRIFGVVNLIYGAALAVVLLEVLPARQLVVDTLGTITALLLITSGLALLLHAPWAPRATRLAATVLLTFGVALLAGILTSIGFLHGIYGAVGQGATAVLLVLLGLLVPYFIVLPILELAHFRSEA